MNKRIAFILPHFYRYYRGGAETQCFYLACELINKGWEVHYIFEHKDIIDEVDEYGIHLHSLPKKKGYLKWQNAQALLQKMKLIQAEFWYSRANISYLHYLVKFAKQVGGKVIWAFSRDSQFLLKDNEQEKASFVVKVYNRFNKKRFFKALKSTNTILLQTKKQAALLDKNLNLKGTVIYNAHPTSDISKKNSLRKKQVLWIGRMRPFKRPDRFIELADFLKDTDITFKMIGKYAEKDLNEILNKRKGSNTKLEILGERKAHEVHDTLSESMLIVNTSEYEGFSNTFIEAWLRGVPVISYQVDPDGMILQNKIGIVKNDVNQLADYIKDICDDQKEWEKVSERCQMHGFENFDITNAVSKLEEILCKL